MGSPAQCPPLNDDQLKTVGVHDKDGPQMFVDPLSRFEFDRGIALGLIVVFDANNAMIFIYVDTDRLLL